LDSFKEILNRAPDIAKMLNRHERYWAHIHSSKNEELLADHVNLVNKYSSKLVEAHGLDSVIESLITSHVSGWENEELCAEMLKECFVGTIVFHDFGKINENFQALRMLNQKAFVKNTNTILKPPHGHSKLGAFLYISYYTDYIFKQSIENDHKIILSVFVCLLGYSIMQHHSPALFFASQQDGYLNSFKDLYTDLKHYTAEYKFSLNEEILVEFFDSIEECWQENIQRNSSEIMNDYKPFPFFALIKLNFSLLTASDYLATHHYSSSCENGNEGEINDFGVFLTRSRINEIAKYLQTFKHNEVVFQKVANYSFEHPLTRSNANLNKLREEMAVEVIQTIRQNSLQRLFYLEAPTGGGKTNLSAIVATELLLANPEINKVYYVFPFTTLITQTFSSLKESTGLGNDEITELHSKSGLSSKQEQEKEKEKDGLSFTSMSDNKKDYIDNLFALYPVTLLSHVKFFDILKTNSKEANYMLHRIANSVVIIDELQSYNPKIWDKILFLISEYSRHFNIRFILMSATLPKISGLKTNMKDIPDFVDLIPHAHKYITNPNFSERVFFNFEIFDQGNITMEQLANKVCEKSDEYALANGSVKAIVEFIYKKSAADFLSQVQHSKIFHQIFVLSGTVLESRRREIINYLKRNDNSVNILLITTQVVEAGVDIDMDIGFKNVSLIDSDEQLAGRVNRNANKIFCEVYLFKMDDASVLYRTDYRYKKTLEEIDVETYKDILTTKNFSRLYDKVIGYIDDSNKPIFKGSILDFTDEMFHFNYPKVDSGFKIIDQESSSVFVPLNLSLKVDGIKSNEYDQIFNSEAVRFLEKNNIYPNEDRQISGLEVWGLYESLIDKNKQKRKDGAGFDIQGKIDYKQLQAIMSKFTFSLMKFGKDYKDLQIYGEEKYGYLYLYRWDDYQDEGFPYTFENGLNNKVFKSSNFL